MRPYTGRETRKTRQHPLATTGLAQVRAQWVYLVNGVSGVVVGRFQRPASGRCEPTTGIVPFTRLAEQVMTTEP